MTRLATLVLLAGALTAAAAGWTRTAPSIRIVDVRPLVTSDPNLRDLLAHHLAVRVQKTHARWRLYVDGRPIEESTAKVIDTPYLAPGPHWLAARLQRTGVWSEPVTLQMPRVVRCWQTDAGATKFSCRRSAGAAPGAASTP